MGTVPSPFRVSMKTLIDDAFAGTPVKEKMSFYFYHNFPK